MALAIPERVERPVPYDLAAEEAVLGSLLLERDAIIKIAPFLRADDFYREAHGWIYAAVLDLYARREPPDTVTLASELERTGRLDSLGGYSYLISLVNRTPTAVHIEYYAHIIERASVLRRLISTGGEIAALGYSEEHDVANVLDKAEQLLFNVSQRTSTKEFASIEQVLNEYYDRIESIQHNPGTVVGVPTGFHDLDEVTGGLQRSDLIIVAARPGVGKTSMVLGMAHNAAMPPRNKRVGVFSLEMSREQLVQRLLAVETGVDSQSLRLGYLSDDEWHLVSDAIGRLAQMPIYIDDSAGLNIHEVRSKARRLEAEVGVDMIIIDYLQLMQGSARKDGNRVQEVSEISRNLKMLAREINVPIIACAQLSRAVESRTSHVPILSDLRESGCLAGETPIYLPDEGVYRPIEQLVGRFGFRVLALNTETWQLEPRPVLKAFATGTKPVYKLATRLGRTIRATANHKFLTLHGWQRLDALIPATRIALPRQLPGPTEKVQTAGITTRQMQAALGNSYCGTALYKQNISRERATRLANVVQSDSLARLAQSHVYWDEITSIEPDGESEVYDLTVDELHNFVAADIIAHNSIEQDADIVMFIHREEMYNHETEKKGIAEIHIAKHRNGPLATIPLRFFSQTTKFTDLEVYRQEP